MKDTTDQEYTERLVRKSESAWKRFLNVQAPYRWNLKRLNLGFTLDVGCGIGRNLVNLDGHGVGVDHNRTSVDVARHRGLSAFTVDEFLSSYEGKCPFDSLLLSHVVEHMAFDNAVKTIKGYLPFLKQGGAIVLITPQPRGYSSDPTHVEYFDHSKLEMLLRHVGFTPQRSLSFPFPEIFGDFFKYNEFCVVGKQIAKL